MSNEPTLSLSSIRGMIVEARAAIAEAEETIRAARERLDDLLLAESLFARLIGREPDADERPQERTEVDDFRLTGDANRYKAGTNKAFFYQVLNEADPPWLTANDIQERATRLKGMDIPMGSVSPGLTEMKDDGVVVRVGLKVALKSRLQENEASYGQAEDASEAGEPELSPEAQQALLMSAAAA